MKDLKALLFYATWDCNFKLKMDNFCDECRRLNIHFQCLNVDDNAEQTIEYEIRNVPAIVIMKGKEVIGIEKGNEGYKNLKRYL